MEHSLKTKTMRKYLDNNEEEVFESEEDFLKNEVNTLENRVFRLKNEKDRLQDVLKLCKETLENFNTFGSLKDFEVRKCLKEIESIKYY